MSEDAKPAKTGRVAEIRQAYTAIRQIDPKIGWWMLGAFVLSIVLVVGLGMWFGLAWWYLVLVALPMGALAASIVMNRRGNKAMYGALKGQPGATGAALSGMGKRGWYAAQEPVAMDAARGTKMNDLSGVAMVFRALGRPGVVLIGEGPRARVDALLKSEAKRVERVAPGVPVHTWVAGDGEGEVPIEKISGKLIRLRNVMTKEEASAVNKRLKALGGMRPPIPAGMDPRGARVSRKGLRGR